MLVLLINRTRTDLTSEQFTELSERAKAFYASIPPSVRIRGEWSAADHSRNFTLMETPDAATIATIAEPFREYVDVEIVPVIEIKGWTVS